MIVTHSYNGIPGWKTTHYLGAKGRCTYAQSKNLGFTKYIQDARTYYYTYDGNGYLKNAQPEGDGGGVPDGTDPSWPGYAFSFSADGSLQSMYHHEKGIAKAASFTYTGANASPLENVGGLNQVLHLNEKHLEKREGAGSWVTIKNMTFSYQLDADGYVKKISPTNLPIGTRTQPDLYTYLKTQMTLTP